MSYNLIDLPKENYQRVISSSNPLYVSVGSLSAADATTLSIGVVVSVFSGTSANMYLQESYDNGTTWADLSSFTADLIGGTGTFKTKVAPQNGPMSPLVRLKVLPAGATLVGISKIWRTFVQSNVMIPRDASISNGATEATLLSVLSDTNDILTSVDGLETLVTSTNTKLDTLHSDNVTTQGYIDGIETLIGSTNTKLDSVIAGLKPKYSSAYVPVIHNFAVTGITAGVYTPIIPVVSAKPTSIRYMITNSSGAYIQMAVNSVDFCVVPPSGSVAIDIEVAASTLINATSDINVSTGKLTISAFV